MSNSTKRMSRRTFFVNTGAAIAAAAALGNFAKHDDYEAVAQNVNTNSSPTDLKITDLRAFQIAGEWTRWGIKIYTNQGLTGLGEIRDGSGGIEWGPEVGGECNPCPLDYLILTTDGGVVVDDDGIVVVKVEP